LGWSAECAFAFPRPDELCHLHREQFNRLQSIMTRPLRLSNFSANFTDGSSRLARALRGMVLPGFMAVAFLVLGTGCQSTTGSTGSSSGPSESTASVWKKREAMRTAIAQEPPGDYFVARRLYKTEYKFWGYVRKPGKGWETAKLVMLNENQQLAPDREQGKLGSDNNFEYRFEGAFSGDTVYEPASNGFYPEFVLRKHTLLSKEPAAIYKTPGATDPDRRVIPTPF
jgi:hypothetical protein